MDAPYITFPPTKKEGDALMQAYSGFWSVRGGKKRERCVVCSCAAMALEPRAHFISESGLRTALFNSFQSHHKVVSFLIHRNRNEPRF